MTTSLARVLLRGSLWAAAGRIVAGLAGFAITVGLVRLLSQESYGTYVIALSVVTLLTTVGVLGLDQTAVRLLSEAVAKSEGALVAVLVRTLLLLATAGAVASAATCLLVYQPLIRGVFDAPELAPFALAVSVWILAAVFQRVIAETFRGLQDLRLATIFGGIGNTGILSNVSILLGVGLFWILGISSLAAVVWLSAGLTVSIALLAGVVLRGIVDSSQNKALRGPGEGKEGVACQYVSEVATIAVPLLTVSVLVAVRSNMDIWLVGIFEPTATVAVYGAAMRLVALVFMPLQVVSSAVSALMAAAYAQGGKQRLEETVRVATTVASVPAVVITSILVLFPGVVLGRLFGEAYRAGQVVLVLLALGHLVNVLAGPNMLVLSLRGEERLAMVGMLFTVTYIGATGIVFGRLWGALGIAVASASGLLLQNVIMMYLARKRLLLWTHVMVSPGNAWRSAKELWRR